MSLWKKLIWIAVTLLGLVSLAVLALSRGEQISEDDFEEMELHSTILIDREGRVHWARTGGEPFGDMAFLVSQLERMNHATQKSAE